MASTGLPTKNAMRHKLAACALESSVTARGQVTIPKAVRDHLRLRPGDRLKFFLHPDGNIALLPTLPASAVRGIVKKRGRVTTLSEIEAAIAKVR